MASLWKSTFPHVKQEHKNCMFPLNKKQVAPMFGDLFSYFCRLHFSMKYRLEYWKLPECWKWIKIVPRVSVHINFVVTGRIGKMPLAFCPLLDFCWMEKVFAYRFSFQNWRVIDFSLWFTGTWLFLKNQLQWE